MSDVRVRAAIKQMEAWLADLTWEPDPEALALWNADFLEALAQAEKAPGWPDLIARAHTAGQLLEARAAVAVEELNRVKDELAAQERGTRALKGYAAGTH
jgi:hypothetical protein